METGRVVSSACLVGRTCLEWLERAPSTGEFELRDGARTRATLEYQGKHAYVQAGQERWLIGPSGPWHLGLRLARAGDGVQLGRFRPAPHGGVVELEDAGRYQWRRSKAVDEAWAFSDEQGREVAQVLPDVGRFYLCLPRRVLVYLSPQAGFLPRLPLLLSLGGYLVVQRETGAAQLAMAFASAAGATGTNCQAGA